ncbi:MAG: 23S rRNA (uracil(1939)-C(5))-methyltransferase RlmD [Coriobacteriales bacterium]|nr:23S rRNA (uracil(1939)-C(5))-methyltransferase RlmD [Coriobacteriales bacterium]
MHEDVRIESLAYTGAGIAHLATGKTVFVRDGLPGDLVRILIQDERDRFARAAIDELLEPSPERVDPPCPYHASCGGCGLQRLSYDAQLRWKRRFVVDALKRIGCFDDAEELVGSVVASKRPWGYRNRVEMEPLRRGKGLALGFHGVDDSAVVPVERCLLLPNGFAELPARLAGALSYALGGAAVLDGQSAQSSVLRRVGVRVSQTTGDVELALWTHPGPCNRAFVAKVLADVLTNSSIVRVLTAGALEKRDIRKVEVLSGRGFWRENLGDFCYRVSAPSFFQVNSPVAALLIERVLADVEPDGKRVADLYSGVGTFTLPLAQRAQQVSAIEMVGSAIRDLRRNLDDAGLDADALGGDVERLLPQVGTLDCAVVDPPRSGLAKGALHAIVQAAPHTLVYVSCDPATLARDLRALVEQGYRLTSATPFDLFPQTWHIETVARLTR